MEATPEMSGNDERLEMGLAIRREVLGREYVANSTQSASGFDADFQRFVTEFCWSTVWGRPGLTRKTRSLLNVAMLCAANRPHELKLHVGGALRNGCTVDEIQEAVFQVAVYCGLPAALDGLRIVREVVKNAAPESGNAEVNAQ